MFVRDFLTTLQTKCRDFKLSDFSVLNTDNLSAVGVTIDYGPYGFMDAYDPGYICNGSGKYVCLPI